MSYSAQPRPWAVFADTAPPRIFMLAQRANDDDHYWTKVAVDDRASTDCVTVWVDGDGDGHPVMIEASGAALGELENDLSEVAGIDEPLWSPTLGGPRLAPSWVWWHDALVVNPPRRRRKWNR